MVRSRSPSLWVIWEASTLQSCTPAICRFSFCGNPARFKVRLIGDLLNREILEKQSDAPVGAGMLDFRGYTTDVASELRAINVMAYLLNPQHYGTAENALLEAMTMGIVPVVLDNPAERKLSSTCAPGCSFVRQTNLRMRSSGWHITPRSVIGIGDASGRVGRGTITPERMGSLLHAL